MKTKIFLTLLFVCMILHVSGQTLKQGNIVVMNTYTVSLNPDVTMNQFISFYKTKYIPEYEKAYPGIKEYVVWGDRGEHLNQLGTIVIFESQAVRDKYYPQADAETNSAEAQAAEEKLKTINAEFGKYVMPGSKRFYTDWIVK